MTNTTAAATKTTVRMFDGTGWAEYKVGSKKHKAAEARRAEWQAARPTAEQKAERKAYNVKAAAWMRENGVTPRGTAWAMVGKGERDVEALKAANAADGIAAPATAKVPADRKAKATKVKAAKAAKAAKAEVVTEVVEAEVVSPKKAAKAARKARSAAAAKGWETRRANAAAKLAAEAVVETKAPKAKKAKAAKAVAVEVDPFETFAAPLFAVGLDSEQVARAWAIKSALA